MPTPIPSTVGRYQVRERLGQGGMGAVYLAFDPVIDRLVAIKLLRFDEDDIRQRFAREARSAGRLQHPNIVTIYDVGEHEGQPFIAMEYVSGETLAAIIQRRSPLSLKRKLEIMEAVCNGLAYAHAAGLVHRDVKPANVLVAQTGDIKILDFGIARLGASSMTQTGLMIGTPNYMAPEQAKGARVDFRSDIFAAGLVLYELLTYRRAFDAESPMGVVYKILQEQPPKLSAIMPSGGAALDAIVDRALRKLPEERYDTLREMREDLARVRHDLNAGDTDAELDAAIESVATPAPPGRRSTDRSALFARRTARIAEVLRAAQSAFEAGDFDDALDNVERAAILDPDDPGVLSAHDAIRRALDARQLRQALDTARAALERGDLPVARTLAHRAQDLGGGKDAEELLSAVEETALRQERAADLISRAAGALAQARVSLAAGLIGDARRSVDEALAWAPDSLEARALRDELLALGVPERAAPEPQKGARLDPTPIDRDQNSRRPNEKPASGTVDFDSSLEDAATIVIRRMPVPEGISPSPSLAEAPDHDDHYDETVLIRAPGKVGGSDELADARLVITDSPDARIVGRVMPLSGNSAVIGRDGDWLFVADPEWSRRHAVIEYARGGFAIRDLGSANGTRVNGYPIAPGTSEALFFGSRVAIGSTVLTFSSARDVTLPDLTGAEVDGRYVLESRLREGAKAVLYAALDKRLAGRVALKLLSPELARYPGYRERFQREAELARQLHHPHICQVLDYGQSEVKVPGSSTIRTYFLCLELMEGGNLADRLERKEVLDRKKVAQWIERLASALALAHRRGLVHRDLKPAAIVFDSDDNPYVTDFAIAQQATSSEGHVTGTPAYMAPELWQAGAPTPAVDQFSLAALSYYMITGSRPFEGQDHPEIRRRNFAQGPLPAHAEAEHHGRPGLLRGVSSVLAKALATSPAERYPTITDFAEALSTALVRPSRRVDAAQLFFSYQRESMSGWVNYFADRIRAIGLSVFVDTHNRDGAGIFPEQLARAIEDCSVFVCFVGEKTLESKWVRDEINLAHQYGKPMIPVFQEGYARPPDDELSPGMKRLLTSQGVHLHDRRNLNPERSASDLAALAQRNLDTRDQSES